jgi:hypothetical protein
MCKNGLGECPSGDFIHVEASPGQGHEKASPRHIFTWFINWQRGKRNMYNGLGNFGIFTNLGV